MSDINTIAGHLISFRGDDEFADRATLVEVTAFAKDGSTEIAFDHGKERIYIKFKLGDLINRVAAMNGDKD